jgi:metal-responsive CopG/Arc/MetJ family transcriptional regulator
MRHKIPDEMKKDKFTITIDEKLNDIVNEYLESNDIKRSNYIEKLIREDMEKKGNKIDRKF